MSSGFKQSMSALLFRENPQSASHLFNCAFSYSYSTEVRNRKLLAFVWSSVTGKNITKPGLIKKVIAMYTMFII